MMMSDEENLQNSGGEVAFQVLYFFSHLVADDVDLVLHLGNPLSDNSEQLWNGGPRIHEDLQTGWIIRVEEGEG